MRLYSLKKKHFFLLAIVYIGILTISITLGVLGPHVLNRNTDYGTRILPRGQKLQTGFFKLSSNPVQLYQKELWLSVIVHRKPPVGKLLRKP